MKDDSAEFASTELNSWASSPGTRASMRSNRGRDTLPELAIRRRLHALGFRYRVSFRPIKSVRRTADVAFTKTRIVVFIDGCFWHGCPEHYQAPTQNADYWSSKLARNRERDAETDSLMRDHGWESIRYWEHEVRSDPDTVVAAIANRVRCVNLTRTAVDSANPST